ncbi:sensor histidine kinase [Maribacter sp. ACAM166]|uniref:sensor histidine kinase n=1 Tax=Maribacter sp. ACAM166 TaxID=2508996 RepID=UPI0010FEDE76|nr:sensor histidine kinase [Maribacter sp. ACAM166]TLP80255.1 hypothetical protein ES765_08675 [Maribacter sp. ACAM166]
MKRTRLLIHHIFFTGFFCSLMLLSCNKASKSETETTIGDYKTPETIPLEFTEPEPFEWETITSDTLTTPVTFSLNVDALPSKPFELNTFKPLKTPMKEYDLDWDNFPTEKLKFDSIPFTVTKSTIKKPTITKMRPPGILKGTHVNLMQLSINEGLKSNLITAFLEREDGTTWISTPLSLNLYDGENTYTYEYSLVNDMTLDSKGRLWLATNGNGMYVLDFKNNIEYTISTPAIALNLVDILYDHTGAIYLAAFNNGIYTMDEALGSLEKLTNEGANLPITLLEDSDKNIWVAFEDGIAIINKERLDIKTLPEDTSFTLNFSTDIKEDKSGMIWFCSFQTEEVVSLSLKQKKAKLLTKENGYTISGSTRIEEDSKGNIWIVGNDEVYILSEDNQRSKTISINSTMLNNRRGSILKRNDGTLWFGTLDKGVVMTNYFTMNTEYFDTSKGLIDDQVWDIEEDSRGELWLGTTKGINIIDPKKNTIKALSHEKLRSTVNNTILFVKEISKDIYFIDATSGFSIFDRKKNRVTQYASTIKSPFVIRGIAAINEYTFFLYTRDGLFLYDIKSNTLKKVVAKNDPDILKAASQSLLVYDKEILWVPSQNGLAKVNLKTNTVSYLSEEQGLCENNVHVAAFSKEEELWLATLNGIAILNLEENTLTNLKEENGLLPAEMYDLIERGDTMYAASVNGLIPIDKASAKTTNKGFYNFNQGLGFKSTDYLEGSAKFLKNGQLWAGVGDLTNEFKLMVIDGAPKLDTIVSSIRITGMFVMDENPGFKENSSIDSLNNKVSSYAVKNQMTWDSVNFPYTIPEGLILPFDQNSLSFSYGSEDIFNRDKLSYRFILDGADENWTYAATATATVTKNYYNLKPGNYTFKVSARNGNSSWSIPDTLSFKINPPWWQTWWAYLLFGIIAASILRVYIVFRARKLTKENKLLEERVSQRTSQLKNKIEELKATQSKLIQSEKMASLGELTAGIAHEIQNPLNFVNNFSEVNKELLEELEEEIEKGNFDEVKALAKDVSANEDKIIFHGKRADGIVKGMLQHSRSSNGIKERTDINTLADEYLRLAYHGLRAKDKTFNATLNTDFGDNIGEITIVPQDIGRVILNLITNAFYVVKKKKEQNLKGFEPTVSVSTKRQGSMVLVSVSDNGNGVPKDVLDKIFQPFFTTKPSGEGTGLGLSLSYDIVKVHGGELNVETEQGQGTTFIISLPMK